MWHGGWQRHEIDTAVNALAAAGRLHNNAVFIDVGAHIGTHTVYALRSGKFSRAVAFEPEPRNARLLAMNLETNGLAQAAIVVRKAAGAAAGNAVLHLHPRNTGAHTIGSPPSLDGERALEVPMVRLDEELAALGIAAADIGLIWIDAEGYEPQVLDGLAALLPHAVPLAFEFTPSRYSAKTKQELVARLAAHYSRFQSLGLGDASGPISALASRERMDDVLVY
jgi:FkbM family methyltransferase